METSGEVADLLVKEGLQVAEVAARLAGQGVVNAAALISALIKQNYKCVGEVDVDRLNREQAESTVIPIPAKDYEKFAALAKKFGVLYSCIKQEKSDVAHVISNTNYAAQLNAVMESMGYLMPFARGEGTPAKKAQSRAPQEKSSEKRGNGSKQQENEKPSVREKLAEYDRAAKEKQRKVPVRDKARER